MDEVHLALTYWRSHGGSPTSQPSSAALDTAQPLKSPFSSAKAASDIDFAAPLTTGTEDLPQHVSYKSPTLQQIKTRSSGKLAHAGVCQLFMICCMGCLLNR